MHDGGFRKGFGKLLTTLFVLFDNGELYLARNKALRQIFRRAAAADDHHMLCLRGINAEVFNEADKVSRVGGDGELVPHLQRETPFWNGDHSAPLHSANERIYIGERSELIQARVGKHIVFLDFELDQFHAPFGERIALEEGWILKQAEDFKRCRLFRVDHHGKAELIL